MTIDSF